MKLKKVSQSPSPSLSIFLFLLSVAYHQGSRNLELSIATHDFDFKKDEPIFGDGEIRMRRSLFFVAEILCVHREKKERMSVVRTGWRGDGAEDTMHGPPDRTGDLLLPFWSRGSLIQNLRKLQKLAEKGGDGTMLGVVSWAILQSNCS